MIHIIIYAIARILILKIIMKKNKYLFKNFVISLVVFSSFLFPASDVFAVAPDNYVLSGGCYWNGTPGASDLFIDAGIGGSVVPANAANFTLDIAYLNYDPLGITLYYRKANTGLDTINYTQKVTGTAWPLNYKFSSYAMSSDGGITASPDKYIYVANPLTGCSSPSSTNGCTDPAASNYNPSATTNDGSCTYATTCYDNAITVFTTPLPDTLLAGQSYPFVVKTTNTGTTRWWHGFAYNMRQMSGLNVSPGSYGLPTVIGVGDDTGSTYTYTLVAPSASGQYTLNMSMLHTDWGSADYMLDATGVTCAPAPGTNIYFGDVASKTFTVLPITISTSASINSATVVPDDATTYNISVSGTDTSGAANVSHLYALINYQGSNAGSYRGYLTWYGPSDVWAGFQDHTGCSLNGSPAPAGGYAVVQPGYGDTYMHLVSCAITTSGDTKTVTYGVRFKPQFLTDGPLTNNDISAFAMDESNALNTGWVNFDTNFAVQTTSGSLSGPASCTIASNGSSCSATISWTLSYPTTVPTTIVGTGTTPTGTFTVSNSLTSSQSGSLVMTVPNGNQTFTLKNNGATLGTPITVTSSCASGTSWDGTKCAPIAVCTVDCAAFVSQTINGVLNPTSITLYSTYSYTANVVMQNTGIPTTGKWLGTGSTKYRLSPSTGTYSNVTSAQVNVPGAGVDGGTPPYSFNTTFTAPAVGTYTYKYRMQNNVNAWFGDTSPEVTINVVPPPPSTPTGLSSSCATVSGVQKVTLQWADQTWENSYTVQISGMSPATLSANTLSYGPTTVTDNVTYTWTVYATNSTGVSSTASGSFKCPDVFLLSVSVATQGGSVNSTNPDTAINCGSSCSATYTNGSVVTLQAVPSSSYWQFSGWSGACSGSYPTCNVTVDANKSVSATFVPRDFNYTEF